MKKVLFIIGATLYIGIGGFIVLLLGVLLVQLLTLPVVGLILVSLLLGFILFGEKVMKLYNSWFIK